ncbi:MAG: zinc-binding alcohol dehydrogenase family protein [Pseudomonadota bacterium]
MKAVGFTKALPASDPNAFVNFEPKQPTPQGHDLRIAVRAVAVNPVDTKQRRAQSEELETPRILGFDACGVVDAVGPDVSLFKAGDAVFYAGDITRPGSNAQYQLVDERIVGRKPETLSNAEAAALPLTSITAWESFFDRLQIDPNGANAGESILIIGGAGGVGSIGIQLAKAAGLTVIATASRPETVDWVTALGADHVINHHEDMVAQTREAGFQHVDHVAIFNDMRHWNTAVELVRPQGGIVTIDATDLPMDMTVMKTKAASLHWEFMFARPMHDTPDMVEQHKLLNRVADMVDAGTLRTTASHVLSPINAATIRQAHEMVERGDARGKIVIEGWV